MKRDEERPQPSLKPQDYVIHAARLDLYQLERKIDFFWLGRRGRIHFPVSLSRRIYDTYSAGFYLFFYLV